MSSEVTIRRKLVIVGDGACGKTSLLSVFALGEFPRRYQPTVFENYVSDCRVDGKKIQLTLWDTAGQEEYERLRPFSYSKADVIIVAFAVDDPQSLDHARTKWSEEVLRYCPVSPIILVGLKNDLRHAKSYDDFVAPHDAETVARAIGAKKYMECSALTGEGVDDVFEAATRSSLLMHEKNEGCCTIV